MNNILGWEGFRQHVSSIMLNNKYNSFWYKKLHEGKTTKFDLTNEGHTFVCNNNSYHTVSKVTIFTRTTIHIRYEHDQLFIN